MGGSSWGDKSQFPELIEAFRQHGVVRGFQLTQWHLGGLMGGVTLALGLVTASSFVFAC